MEELRKELGKIDVARIYRSEYGLAFEIHINFGNGGQNFGGVSLDTPSEEKKRRVGTAGGCDFIVQMLNLFNIEEFGDMVGRTVYALQKYGMIVGLELPKFEGGGRFLLEEWQREWFGEEQK
jgi:hypothetical protein